MSKRTSDLLKRLGVTLWCAGGLFAVCAMALDAQEAKDQKKADETDKATRRASMLEEWSGYGRHGLPESRSLTQPTEAFDDDDIRQLVRTPNFTPAQLKMFLNLRTKANVASYPIHGGTVYYHVFENVGVREDDIFDTGIPNLEQLFVAGDAPVGGASPRFDRKAKYLYLYQVVNDRGYDARKFANVVGKDIKDDPVTFAVAVEKKAAEIHREDIATFSLKIHVDPLYITSWGSFTGAAFAAKLPDRTQRDVIRVAQGLEAEKAERKIIPFSPNVSVLNEIKRPEFRRHARANPLSGELNNNLSVKPVDKTNLTQLASYKTIKLAAGQLKNNGGVTTALFDQAKDKKKIENTVASLNKRIERVEKGAVEPTVVELKTRSNEERVSTNLTNLNTNTAIIDDDATTAVFHVEFGKPDGTGRWKDALKNGELSTVFGFTSDLPPITTKTRVATPPAAEFTRENLTIANYFSLDAFERAVSRQHQIALAAAGGQDAPAANPNIVQVVGGAPLSLTGLAFNQLAGVTVGDPGFPTPSPAPAAAPAAPGFAGVTGGMGVGSLGGAAPVGGIGGALGFPALGSIGAARGATGGGGGITGGGGGDPSQGGGQTGSQTGQGQNQNTSSNVPTINFNATLNNQQSQNQNQSQKQNQGQKQNQNQSNHGGHGHHHHGNGHVVPAPPSLLLGLLGLPALFFLRRRKDDATQTA